MNDAGIRTFGKNFKIIAEVIGTKTESHLRSFFVNYRRRYNLDTALKVKYSFILHKTRKQKDDIFLSIFGALPLLFNAITYCYFVYFKEYEAEHGPTPSDDVDMENGGTGKSGSSSGAGTPRGQDSGSVSPTHDGNIAGATIGGSSSFPKNENTGSEDKSESVDS